MSSLSFKSLSLSLDFRHKRRETPTKHLFSITQNPTGRGRGRGRGYKHFGPAQYDDRYWTRMLKVPDSIPPDPSRLRLMRKRESRAQKENGRNKFGYAHTGGFPSPGGSDQYGRGGGPGIPPPGANLAHPWYRAGGSYGPNRMFGNSNNFWSRGQYRTGTSNYPNSVPAASPFLMLPPPLQGDWYMPKNPPPNPSIKST